MARNDERILQRCFDDDERVERRLRSYRVIFQRDASNESRAGRGFNKPGHNLEGGGYHSLMCVNHINLTLFSLSNGVLHKQLARR